MALAEGNSGLTSTALMGLLDVAGLMSTLNASNFSDTINVRQLPYSNCSEAIEG
jgi:hypothetical protein